ncbi:hypothetical protein [Pseudomonas aeruginosa]|uniref:hypothetical protein n=1 Tax=Pseudomonas aeruginosa TaxID=287 RepID=UPI0012986264|nr:hypothetical protein [Pseudomonas aeruginosa]EKV8015543.1 hypothetical protein [Pseudomonas aeruginosa]EKX2802083.1 hypothetical protein [Pseudomonas aeruginosa]MBG5798889.1 hypothetical protein [Pseudomonas aeruginosa]MBH3771391.1 hypothetical protein [Pseudomonas aeruginosa]MBP8320006.1 hypothetical protein [Pseudomonas aeruginosa]
MRAQYDESLPSWVLRCALSTNCSIICYADAERFENVIRGGEGWLEAFLDDLAGGGVRRETLQAFFSSDSELDSLVVVSTAYCASCLFQDVRQIGSPYWRRSWDFFGCAYCAEHRVPLIAFNARPGVFSAWHSFYEACEYFDQKVKLDPVGKQRVPTSIRDYLAYRVQIWVKHRMSGASAKLIRLLLMSFLSVRTDSRAGGYGRFLFSPSRQQSIVHKKLNFQECLEMGAAAAPPWARSSALLLLGVVFGLFSQRELHELKMYALNQGYLFPENLQQLGASILIFVNRDEVEEFSDQLQLLSASLPSIIRTNLCEFASSLVIAR